MIPEDWEFLTVDKIKSKEKKAIISGPFGSNISKKYFVESGVPVIRGNNLTTDMKRFIDEGFVFVTTEKADELNTWALVNDIIFTAAGTLGQVGVIEKNSKFEKYIISNKQLRLRVDEKEIRPLYAFYWFASPIITKLIVNHNTGSTVPLINLSVLKNLPIAVPPLKIQDSIVNILDSLDQKIELNRQMNSTLEQIAQSLFKRWFINFEFPDENGNPYRSSGGRMVDSELGQIPEGWGVGTLGDIAEVIDCLHSKKPERTESGKPLLQLWNIRDDGLIDMEDTYHISESDYNKWISRIEAVFGDCVITNVGRVGAVSQVPDYVKAALGRNMTAIRCNSQYYYPTYLIELLLSDYMKKEISLKTDNGTVMSALNVKNIPKLSIILPSKKVLQTFEHKVRPLREKMESNHQQSMTLKSIRDSLLPKLMSGKIRVPTNSE
jgi:type I restriction enzyme S subunit